MNPNDMTQQPGNPPAGNPAPQQPANNPASDPVVPNVPLTEVPGGSVVPPVNPSPTPAQNPVPSEPEEPKPAEPVVPMPAPDANQGGTTPPATPGV